ncbi:MAG TPA: 1-deoxy-D-xylulose-5-phosphate synthase [Candidatus Sumerlaeota bacterium]|nr:1-deoxy-D-xylulose-5-phosphate synthase [Candidatus Sumerlaeota bacterium]
MAQWLERIQEPRDIRGLALDDLRQIAEEIRETMLRVTAVNGGHLASSMGAVELILALHYVYDTPRDRLVFDVGHQAYAHKLLTGRYDRFHTIRREGGLSGFLKRSESPYDTFGAGHASTSISAAAGMAIARDQRGEDYKVVCITGDGAMSGGICYEALNHAGMLETDLLVILNDNEMSISRNVGGLARTFNRIVTTHFYNEKRHDIMELIRRLPAGERFLRMTNRIEESVKGLILPGLFFEELGFRYLGPVDGHDLEGMIEILRKIRTFRGPILLHTITRKGKGRPYAEANPILWHSPPRNFDADSGEAPVVQPGPPSYTNLFVDSLKREARRDPRIVAITAAMLEGTGLVQFEEEFPERTFDVGIAEEHGVICAAGMACDGLRPFVCIYSTFLQRAFDPIIHDVCIQNLPVVFALDRGGLVGDDGPTHHGVFDLSYLRMVPNMVVMAPMDGEELRHMTHTAALYEAGPIALRFPRGSAEGDISLDAPVQQLPLGKGVWLHDEPDGAPVCLVGIGLMAAHARKAADLLAARGIRAGVINARFVKPLDRELLTDAARRYDCLVTIEDNVLAGGFGSAVMELLAADGVDVRVLTLGIPDRFIEHAKPDSLHRQLGLDPAGIAARVEAFLAARPRVQELAIERRAEFGGR